MLLEAGKGACAVHCYENPQGKGKLPMYGRRARDAGGKPFMRVCRKQALSGACTSAGGSRYSFTVRFSGKTIVGHAAAYKILLEARKGACAVRHHEKPGGGKGIAHLGAAGIERSGEGSLHGSSLRKTRRGKGNAHVWAAGEGCKRKPFLRVCRKQALSGLVQHQGSRWFRFHAIGELCRALYFSTIRFAHL